MCYDERPFLRTPFPLPHAPDPFPPRPRAPRVRGRDRAGRRPRAGRAHRRLRRGDPQGQAVPLHGGPQGRRLRRRAPLPAGPPPGPRALRLVRPDGQPRRQRLARRQRPHVRLRALGGRHRDLDGGDAHPHLVEGRDDRRRARRRARGRRLDRLRRRGQAADGILPHPLRRPPRRRGSARDLRVRRGRRPPLGRHVRPPALSSTPRGSPARRPSCRSTSAPASAPTSPRNPA